MSQMGRLRKTMVYDRNTQMVESFLSIAKGTTLFAAVGGGHLYGRKGMLPMLKHSGCRIRPVKPLHSNPVS
ncbi:MAG: hypothetical protein HKN16_06760 [Saprospiraceae bacterium]|nr:hypothetical protein [Saprospiraceae bacterium]